MDVDSPLGRYPVSTEIPVAWGEMDSFQHVNNTVYLRWFETARILYFQRIGLLERTLEEGVGPILARSCIDYRRPVTWPDTVRVDVAVTRIGGKSFTMGYRVWSAAQKALVAGGESVLAVYDYRAAKSAPVDDRLRAAIEALERTGPAIPDPE